MISEPVVEHSVSNVFAMVFILFFQFFGCHRKGGGTFTVQPEKSWRTKNGERTTEEWGILPERFTEKSIGCLRPVTRFIGLLLQSRANRFAQKFGLRMENVPDIDSNSEKGQHNQNQFGLALRAHGLAQGFTKR